MPVILYLGYVIQRKEKGSPYWVHAAQVPANQNHGTVDDLIENQEYEFRVIALNAAGQSEPSLPSEMVMCRPRRLAPRITSPMNDVTIRRGQIFHSVVNFVGAPEPECIWTLNGKAVVTDARTTVSALSNHTILHAVDAKRSDSGEYVLKIKNEHGSDEGSFKLTVLDVPFPPEDVNYEEVTAQSVTLSWKRPKDDGGSEIVSYAIEKKSSHGGGWVPAVNFVDPRNTHAVVPRLTEGTQYEFRVFGNVIAIFYFEISFQWISLDFEHQR